MRKRKPQPLPDEPSSKQVNAYFDAVESDRDGDGVSQGRLRYECLDDDEAEYLSEVADPSENVLRQLLDLMGFGPNPYRPKRKTGVKP